MPVPGTKSTSARGVQARSAAYRPWRGRWRTPWRSTRSGRRRSAPRGWSCRSAPRRGPARRRRRCRGPTSRGWSCRPLEEVAFPVGGRGASSSHARRSFHADSAASDGPRQNGPVSTFYDEIGGYETFRRIVAQVLRGRRHRPGAPAALPRGGPRPGRGAVPAFLIQYWGGPTTYSDTRGHPRLRMRHAPFAVTPAAAERWLAHFRAALDEPGSPRSRTRSSGTTSPTPRSSWSTRSRSRPEAVSSRRARLEQATPGSPPAARAAACPSSGRRRPRTTGPGAARVSPSRISDSIVNDVVPTAGDPRPAVVGLGAEQDRLLVVDVGLGDDHGALGTSVGHVAPRAGR